MRMVVTGREVQLKPDTDTHQVDEGFVTVTGLIGFRVSQATANGNRWTSLLEQLS